MEVDFEGHNHDAVQDDPAQRSGIAGQTDPGCEELEYFIEDNILEYCLSCWSD